MNKRPKKLKHIDHNFSREIKLEALERENTGNA